MVVWECPTIDRQPISPLVGFPFTLTSISANEHAEPSSVPTEITLRIELFTLMKTCDVSVYNHGSPLNIVLDYILTTSDSTIFYEPHLKLNTRPTIQT